MTTPVTTPALTLREAVEVTGASLSTMRRRVREGAFPGVFTDGTGARRVPVVDLLAAGFTVDRVTPDHPDDHPLTTGEQPSDPAADRRVDDSDETSPSDVVDLDELHRLRVEVIDLRARGRSRRSGEGTGRSGIRRACRCPTSCRP